VSNKVYVGLDPKEDSGLIDWPTQPVAHRWHSVRDRSRILRVFNSYTAVDNYSSTKRTRSMSLLWKIERASLTLVPTQGVWSGHRGSAAFRSPLACSWTASDLRVTPKSAYSGTRPTCTSACRSRTICQAVPKSLTGSPTDFCFLRPLLSQ
jgi:hypothetical protein